MNLKISKRLVIDASIARAAGGEDATQPTSKNCRDFLKAVLDICHRMVMTPEIKEEWNKHESIFARRWRSSMVAKKKLEYYAEIPVDNELWEFIDCLAETDNQRLEMFKDLRLIEAALFTDKIVISLDEKTARKFFNKAATGLEILQDIVWVNPDQAEEKAIDWLEKGAEPAPERLLGFMTSE